MRKNRAPKIIGEIIAGLLVVGLVAWWIGDDIRQEFDFEADATASEIEIVEGSEATWEHEANESVMELMVEIGDACHLELIRESWWSSPIDRVVRGEEIERYWLDEYINANGDEVDVVGYNTVSPTLEDLTDFVEDRKDNEFKHCYDLAG